MTTYCYENQNLSVDELRRITKEAVSRSEQGGLTFEQRAIYRIAARNALHTWKSYLNDNRRDQVSILQGV